MCDLRRNDDLPKSAIFNSKNDLLRIILLVALRLRAACGADERLRRNTGYFSQSFDGVSGGLAESRDRWKNDGLVPTKTTRCQSHRKEVPGEELVWIEDKILQFAIPDLPPGNYTVTIHDDKGPPGDTVYSVLETTAYVIFPPVWPFVFRSNQWDLSETECCR